MDKFCKHNIEWEKRYKWVHTIWLHLHKVQRQANLIYGIRSQIMAFLGAGYWLEGGTGELLGYGNILSLDISPGCTDVFFRKIH